METKDLINDPSLTLEAWSKLINKWIERYGKYTILFTDGGYNNVDLRILKPQCKKHRKYTGKRPPKDCEYCKGIYNFNRTFIDIDVKMS